MNVSELIQKAQNESDTGIRREAIIELGYLKDDNIYPVLLKELNDPAASIQHAAIISLRRFGNANAIKELIKPKILRSSTVNVRWAAVEAIGELGDYHCMEHLVAAAEDEAWIVRNQAVTELKSKIREVTNNRNQHTAHLLIRLLAMEDREIVDMAIDGLIKIGPVSIPLLCDGLKSISSRIRENATATLGRMKVREAMDAILDLLVDKNWWVRRAAVRALGQIENPQAIEPLVRCLSDNVEEVQKEAIASLVSFGDKSTKPLLNTLVHEPSKYVIRAILYTLGDIQDTEAIPALIEHLSSSYFVIRNAAAKALVKFGTDVIDSILPNLSCNQANIEPLMESAENDADTRSQLRAIRALGALEEHRAVGILKRTAASEDDRIASESEKALTSIGKAAWGRCSCLIVLRELGDPEVLGQFICSLSDSSANVRLEAIRGLGRFGGQRAIESLISVAQDDADDYVRAEAILLLRQMGSTYPEVTELAYKALKDKDRTVRMHAAALLGINHDDRSIKPLISAMTDPHWGVREAAETSLMNLGARATDALLLSLASSSWTLRFRAARLLGEIGDPAAIIPLEGLLKKRGERKIVREIVQEALDKLEANNDDRD